MTAVEPVIRIEGLVKRFGTLEAVRGVQVEVRRGEVFGFLGPNGAGKSTTIRCLLGLLRPSAGRIRVFGLDASREGVAVRRRLTYLPGELRLPERISGSELVASIGRLRGGIDPNRRDALSERLQVDLDRPLRDLSSGNRRKIALLLAFLPAAELLILDEPTNGLDPLMQREFRALVREAREAGATIFLSSHSLGEVQLVADRVAVLRAGALVAEGTVADLRARARQRVEIWFKDDPATAELNALPGIIDPLVEGRHFTATLSGPIQPLLEFVARHPVASLLAEEPDLEEAFLDLYSAGAG